MRQHDDAIFPSQDNICSAIVMEDIESDSGADSVMVYIMPSKTEQQHNINMLQVAPEEQKPDAFDFYDSYATLHKSSSKNKLQQTKESPLPSWQLRFARHR